MIQREMQARKYSQRVQKMLHNKHPTTQRKILQAQTKAVKLRLARQTLRPYSEPVFYPESGINTKTIEKVLRRWKNKALNGDQIMSYDKILATAKKGNGGKNSASASFIARRFIQREFITTAKNEGFSHEALKLYERLLNSHEKTLRITHTKNNPEGTVPILDPSPLIIIKLINKIGQNKFEKLAELTKNENKRIQKIAYEQIAQSGIGSDVFANTASFVGAKLIEFEIYQSHTKNLMKDAWSLIENRNHLRQIIAKEKGIQNANILDKQFKEEIAEGIAELGIYLQKVNLNITDIK